MYKSENTRRIQLDICNLQSTILPPKWKQKTYYFQHALYNDRTLQLLECKMIHTKYPEHKWPTYACCSHEVPGMILLHDLQGAMQLDHSKDMYMHVSTCTSYDLNTLTPAMWK